MLRHLNNHEMGALTNVWVTNPQAKATFLSIADIAAIHPKIVKVDREILALLPVANETSATLQEIMAESAEVDVVHDALARAVSAGIEADRCHCLAAKPPQVERAEELEQAYAKLFPTGLAIVNASYLAEFGNTARVGMLLQNEPNTAALLEAIPVRDGGSLLDVAKRWIATGKKLGKLEHERDALTAKEITKAVSLATITAVRSRWLRLVSLILSNLELSEAPEEAIEVIRGPVQRASERAGLRYVKAGADPSDATPLPADPESLMDTAASA